MKEENSNIILGIVIGIIIGLFLFSSNNYTNEQREYLNEEGGWIENCR